MTETAQTDMDFAIRAPVTSDQLGTRMGADRRDRHQYAAEAFKAHGRRACDDVVQRESLTSVSRSVKRVPLALLAVEPGLSDSPAFQPQGCVGRASKRTMDVVTSFMLGAVMLPFLPAVAVAIRLDSPGPVFYSQMRVGLHGRLFRIHKLRTMARDAEKDGAVYAAAHDPRITRVGRFLRRTRIDEVPQLWNILKGEMSLVGPRPERPENLATLEANLPGFAIRTRVRPGITGWAQVSVPYAGTIEQTGNKLEYDLYYVMNASVLFDLEILARTFAVVLGRKGQ